MTTILGNFVRLLRAQDITLNMPAMQSDTQMTGAEEQSISLPGFGQPLEYLPKWIKTDEEWLRYPHAIADCVASEGVTLRERRMLEFVNQITDKPEWERKVCDEEIVAKWHGEACKYHEDIGDDYLSEAMWDYVRGMWFCQSRD